MIQEIGTRHHFKGTFKLEKTDNLFLFIKENKEDFKKRIYDEIDGTLLFKYGKPSFMVRLNEAGFIVGQGLFTVKSYPNSIFRYKEENAIKIAKNR